MDNLASGTNKQFRNLLDLVGPRPSTASDGMGFGLSVGDDQVTCDLTALGPSVGDDGSPPPPAPDLTALGPCVGDDDIRGDDVFAPATLTVLGPSVGDDGSPPV
jgi:hypothetical protein